MYNVYYNWHFIIIVIVIIVTIIIIIIIIIIVIFQMKCLQTGFPIALSVKELSNLVSFQTLLKLVE